MKEFFKKLWKNIKSGFYGGGVILLGWLSYKTMYGTQAEVFKKPQMPEGYKICLIGDTGTGSSSQKEVAKHLDSENCDEIRFLGDVIYDHGISSEDDPQFFSKFYDIYKPLNKPLYISLGNHDYRKNIKAWIKVHEKYDDVFFPYYYYAEQYGDVCILTLNTTIYNMIIKGVHAEDHEEFIDETLKGWKDSCKLTFSVAHHPYISSGSHGNSFGKLKKFYEDHLVGKIDIIFAGHEHNLAYEGVTEGTYNIISGSGAKIRLSDEFEGKDLSGNIDLPQSKWINFNYGYFVMEYKGEGRVILTQKYLREGKLKTGPYLIDIKGKGVR